MATESFDEVICIENEDDAAKMMAALKTTKKTKTSKFKFHDEDDVKSVKEIYGH